MHRSGRRTGRGWRARWQWRSGRRARTSRAVAGSLQLAGGFGLAQGSQQQRRRHVGDRYAAEDGFQVVVEAVPLPFERVAGRLPFPLAEVFLGDGPEGAGGLLRLGQLLDLLIQSGIDPPVQLPASVLPGFTGLLK